MHPNRPRRLTFSLQTLMVLTAVAAVVCGIGLVIRESVKLFTERDLASFLPSFRAPPSFVVDAIVLASAVIVVFAAWQYYRITR